MRIFSRFRQNAHDPARADAYVDGELTGKALAAYEAHMSG
jgi:hypothetical protein